MGEPETTILVVEDEESFVEALTVGLKREGFRVIVGRDGAEALSLFHAVRPDLVLLDVMLPKISGIDVCREIRTHSRVPIIMVTAKTSEIDTVVGLEVGADDYITKPFDARELAARLGAHLRRSAMMPSPSREGVIAVGTVEIDTQGRRVRVGEREIKLTMTEFDLLALLAANPGRVLTRAQLLEKVWGYLAEVDYHSVDPHIQRLRKKLDGLGESGVSLEAVPGLGYRLSSKPA